MVDNLTDVERILLQINGTIPKLLFVLVGPSGVGKNTIIKKLLTNNPHMDRIRTYTTRPPRQGETQGEQYHFVSHDEFRTLATDGKLMEADETTVGHDVYGLGALYSMPGNPFEEIPPDKHLVIAEVDIDGMRRLREQFEDCITIFISAPPVDLKQRIRERPDKHMNEDSLSQRMQTAREQIRSAGEFDYLVVNEDDGLDATVKVIETIVAAERTRVRQGIDLQKIIPSDAFGHSVERDSSV
jgi:guanylate kinase